MAKSEKSKLTEKQKRDADRHFKHYTPKPIPAAKTSKEREQEKTLKKKSQKYEMIKRIAEKRKKAV